MGDGSVQLRSVRCRQAPSHRLTVQRPAASPASTRRSGSSAAAIPSMPPPPFAHAPPLFLQRVALALCRAAGSILVPRAARMAVRLVPVRMPLGTARSPARRQRRPQGPRACRRSAAVTRQRFAAAMARNGRASEVRRASRLTSAGKRCRSGRRRCNSGAHRTAARRRRGHRAADCRRTPALPGCRRS
jgi:hypothetical protein